MMQHGGSKRDGGAQPLHDAVLLLWLLLWPWPLMLPLLNIAVAVAILSADWFYRGHVCGRPGGKKLSSMTPRAKTHSGDDGHVQGLGGG